MITPGFYRLTWSLYTEDVQVREIDGELRAVGRDGLPGVRVSDVHKNWTWQRLGV